MAATFHPAELASGTLTTWLPLTTTFASNPACSSAIYSQVGGQLVAFDPFYAAVIDVQFNTRCLPFEGTMWWNQRRVGQGTTTIVSSLGPMICPDAYTTAFTLSLESATTRVACCPSGYAFQGTILDIESIGQCKSTLSAGERITYMTRSSEPWFKTSSIVGNGGTFVAGLQLNGWNFGDANIQSEHTQSNGATGVLTPTSAFRSFPSSNSSISPTSDNIDAPVSSNDLSRGVTVKVIAGVSAGILGIGIFLLTFFLFRRKKRKQIVEEHGLRAEQSFVESRKSFKFVKPHIPVARQEMPT